MTVSKLGRSWREERIAMATKEPNIVAIVLTQL
jgi:hypothetical protein